MHIFVDDQINEPDVFILKALSAKVDALNQRINELVTTGKNKAELERLVSTRADFMEVLRSPRLFLARPAGAVAPSSGTATAATTSPASGPATSRPTAGGIPFGAVPQPRKVGAPTAQPSQPPPAAPATPSAAPTQKAGGMLGFLKGVQSQSPGEAAPTPTSPSAPPATSKPPAAPAAKAGGMLSFLKGVQSQAPTGGGPAHETSTPGASPVPSPARTPASDFPAATPPPPSAAPSAGTGGAEPPSKGQMLSFLEKVKTAGSTPVGAIATGASRAKELSYESKKALIEMVKARAASTGFQDIYEMLNYKKEKLIEHRAALLKTSNLPAAQVTALIDREIAEIDGLLMKRPQDILPEVQEFDEVAKVDTGGLAAIRLELKGLLDEIK